MQAASVKVFGRFRVLTATGEQAAFRTTRAAEIVALLAVQPNGRLRRAAIAQEIWPELSGSDQLRNLRPALHYARSALGGDEILTDQDEFASLGLAAQSDWHQAKRLDLRITAEAEPSERLMLLFSLAELVRKPLFESWQRDWIEPYRARHAQLHFRVLHSLAEELALRGETSSALEYANQLADANPLNELAIRLQLRLLGQVDRLAEAQHVYGAYRSRLKESLDLEVSPELKAIAQRAVSGGYSSSRVKLVPSVQLELVQSLLTMLAEDSPERLLPLFAAPEVNWAVVTHGPELRSILESVLEKTSGWSPDRAAVAKRLLQFYSQEGEYQRLRRLATHLLESPRIVDQIAALNYLGEVATSEGHRESAEHAYERARALATEDGQAYLAAVSRSNLAQCLMAFADFDGAQRHFS
ncbi:MAG: BTAD domain-containing putative transcriptional regulator, partial [Armatimonadota bacterium]